MIDIDAYFSRIRYEGNRFPSLATLRAIHIQHTLTIPFENLNPLLGLAVSLDPDMLQKKLVCGGRGGWCYEHNLLFSHVLRQLGFDVTWLAARVRWMVPEGTIMPRTHMVLLVTIDSQRYLADVGFGGLTTTEPLKLIPDIEQQTTHESCRLRESAGTWALDAKLAGAWIPLYTFDLNRQELPDYELTNWYLGHNPGSRFVTNLITAKVEPDRRFALFNGLFTTYDRSGTKEQQNVESVAELKSILTDKFRITLPDTANLDEKMQNVLEKT